MLKEKCPYFGRCGGCVWQDLSQQDYIAKKESFILHAFRDVGLDVQLSPMVLIPTGTRRRASFAFMGPHFGYNEMKSHKIVDITACPLLTLAINAAIPILKQTIAQLKSSGDCFVLDTPSGLDIHVKDKKGMPKLAELELLSTLNQESSIARVIYNDTPIFEKTPLPATADSFAQPSQEGENTLIRLMLENVGDAKKAVDLFCGKGTFTKPLIEKGLSVMGYDNSNSVHALGVNGNQRDLFRNPLIADELNGIDLAVLDPPRAGALAQVQQLAQANIPNIIMISCNPKTAARDMKLLIDVGWHIQKIIPIDQFTYSNHIELLAVLRK
ncbi:MAG: class I SAM-dependent RNA methyltransferase [Alphaproteobacteria bacterium]|nr:class I SAM-dependent RNA methyltransferase [Alphaproteobacteria bacterium]